MEEMRAKSSQQPQYS